MNLEAAGRADGAPEATEPTLPAGWQPAFDDMARQTDALRAVGAWRSGERTLLHALGLQNRELVLTAGLRWLLTPEAHHGLGDRVLRSLAAHVGAELAGTHPVTLIAEESRDDGRTRADLVVRAPGLCLLIESKVHAGEQPDQCDRLARQWADEDPVLVFLTRDGREPYTARESSGLWKALSWSDIARMAQAASDEATDLAPGVAEYLQTLMIFQGRGAAVTIDAKTDFFLAHREQIQEWAAIQAQAAERLHQALVSVADRLPAIADEGSVDVRQLQGGWWAVLARRPEWNGDGRDVAIGVGWGREKLLGPGEAPWPYVGIAVRRTQARRGPLAAAVKDTTQSAARTIGLTRTDGGWPWWSYISEPGTFDIDELADQCAAKIAIAWEVLAPAIDEAIALL